MIVGTVREIKAEEYRAGLTPEGAHALVDAGHRVLVESRTGAGVGFSDEAYAALGRDGHRERLGGVGRAPICW